MADLTVFVALGGNDKGDFIDVATALNAALDRMETEGLRISARSSWWRSAAWPDASDPPFLNGVAALEDAPDPAALMALLTRIEMQFGRRRGRPNAPRTLDLDLIAHGRRVGDFDGVIVPHPRAADRLFVMGPLAEIAPGWVHPVSGRTATAMAAAATVGMDARPVAGPGRD